MAENVVLQWAGFGIRPARSVWYEFRNRLEPFLDGWFEQTVTLGLESGLTDASQGAMDGSTIATPASRHRLLNREQLERRLEQLAAACMWDEAEQPVEKKEAWMASTPAGRRSQRARYQRARDRLQERLDRNARRIPSERLPEKQVVISPTDPEAALGPDKFKTFRPLYNALTVIDLASPLILAWDVFSHGQDTSLLTPMLQRARLTVGARLHDLLVDSGFVTGMNLAFAAEAGLNLIGPWKENDFSAKQKKDGAKKFSKDDFTWLADETTYVCPAGHWLKRIGNECRLRAGDQKETLTRFSCAGETCAACPLRPRCTESRHGRQVRRSEREELIEAHRAKMKTAEAKALSRHRGQTVERGFADLKEHRGARRFSGRGLQVARAEVGLSFVLHNLLTIHTQRKSTSVSNHASP